MTMILQTIEQEAAACRAAWAAAPDVILAHGLHHDQHYEELNGSAESRIAYILTHKPDNQQSVRLRYFRPCTDLISRQWRAACREWRDAYWKLMNAPEFIAEHDRLFPGCPWDGHTFF